MYDVVVIYDICYYYIMRSFPCRACRGCLAFANYLSLLGLAGTCMDASGHHRCSIERYPRQPAVHCSSLNALNPGSGLYIPAMCHDTGVWHVHFTSESSY